MAILLRTALQEMDKLDQYNRPVLFDCLVCTFSRQRKEGGKLIEYKNVFLTRAERRAENIQRPLPKSTVRKSQPSNFLNKTRLIKLENGDIRKFRIRLLLEFNGETVVD